MIELKNICKSFGNRKIFDNYSVTIESGSFTIIIGESGCGKTTMLDMIGDIEKPDSGDIVVDGNSLAVLPQRIYFRDYVGFLFQNFALIENRTVRENLNIIRKSNRTDITIEEGLRRVGLLEVADKKVYCLSGGEQQRVALARLMIKRCSLVLADEPTGSLDEKNGRIVMDQLHVINEEGRTVIMVTHDRKWLSEATQVIELSKFH